MDEPGAVDVLEGVGEPRPQEPYGTRRQRPVRPRGRDRGAGAAGDDAVERGPGDVPRGDPGDGRLGVGVQYGRGPRAADAVRGADLLAEAGAELVARGQFAVDELEGHRAAPVRAGEEDPAHAAFAEAAEEPVRADAVRVVGTELFHGALPPLRPARG